LPNWDNWFEETLEVDEWKQLDVSMSYQVNENVVLTFDASNLLDPNYVEYINGEKNFVNYFSSWGRNFNAGIRVKF